MQNENPAKTLTRVNQTPMTDIIAYLQWNWLLLQQLTAISNSLIHIKMQMIVYRNKVVAELTDDVITKMLLTSMLAIMKSTHFRSPLAPPIGEKERLQRSSCSTLSENSNLWSSKRASIDCTSLTLANFNEYLFDYLSYQIETFEYVDFFETINRHFMCVCNHNFYPTENKAGFKLMIFICTSIGFCDIIVKPLKRDILRPTIRNWTL